MTVDEFKAWLSGFSEAIDGAPTAAQWAKIQDKIKSLRASPGREPDYGDIFRRWMDQGHQRFGERRGPLDPPWEITCGPTVDARSTICVPDQQSWNGDA
jgi:hypothetical protein